jgi:hypothetical protein
MSPRAYQRLSGPLIPRIANQRQLFFAVQNAHPTDPKFSVTIRV